MSVRPTTPIAARSIRFLIRFGLPALVIALAFIPCAQGQTVQPFVNHQNHYLYPMSQLLGTAVVGGNMVQLETDGIEGLTTNDYTFPYPADAAAGLVSPNLHLSPTRRWLVISGTPSGGSAGIRYFIYRVPEIDGDSLEVVVSGETLVGDEAFHAFFDYDIPGLDSYYSVVENEVAGDQLVLWVNLVSGSKGYTLNSGPGFSNLAKFQFAPNGLVALVSYTGSDGSAGSTHKLIGLCDDTIGNAMNPGGSPFAEISGGVTAELWTYPDRFEAHLTGGGTFWNPTLDDCVNDPVADIGVCCLAGNCLPYMTQVYCQDLGGTWQGANTDCATITCPPAPAPIVAVSISGPVTTSPFTVAPYIISCTNTGNAIATNAVARVNLSSLVGFVSATNGGVYNGTNNVTWNLGDLAAGATVDLGLELEADCSVSSISLNSYYISTDETGVVIGSPNLVTTVSPLPTDPVSLAISVAVPGGQPLQTDDTIIYTFDLVNLTATDHAGLKFAIGFGGNMELDVVLDDAGGTLTEAGSYHNWTGDLAGFASAQLVVQLKLSGCRESALTTQLYGNSIAVRNQCGVTLGSGTTPPPITVAAPDLELSATVTNVPAPRLVGADWFPAMQLVRRETDLDVTMKVVNRGLTTMTGLLAVLQLGELAAVGDPPFVGPQPPMVLWNAPTNEVAWTGSLAPGDSVEINLTVLYPAGASCSVALESYLMNPGCAINRTNTLKLVAAETPWSESHLVVLNPFQGVQRYRPGQDTTLDDWLCLTGEIFNDINANDDGSMWVGGLPSLRLDPVSLETIHLGTGFLRANGFAHVASVVEDPVNDLVYLTGYENDPGDGTEYLRVRSWDSVTGQVVALYDETAGGTYLGRPQGMEIDQNGHLAIVVSAGILQLDPALPASATLLNDPAFVNGYRSLGLASNGQYLVSEYTWGSVETELLASIDPATGDHTTLVPNLNFAFGVLDSPYVAVAEGGAYYYLASESGQIVELDPSEQILGLSPLPGTNDSHAAMYYVMGSTSAVGDPPVVAGRMFLHGATPNPFNPRTKIAFEIPRAGTVKLAIHDVRGRRVATLIDGELAVGLHEVLWDGVDNAGRAVASGVYFSRLVVAGEALTRKMVLAR